MGKKKTSSESFNHGKNAAEKRFGDRDLKVLQQEAEQLQKAAAALTAFADSMKTQGVATIRVDGVTKFSRGIESIDSYILAVKIALLKAKASEKN